MGFEKNKMNTPSNNGTRAQQAMEGFHKATREERLRRLREFCDLSEEDTRFLSGEFSPSPELAESFIENVVGYFPVPMGIATNFRVDGRDLMIPMAVEETSIIAAASATASWIRKSGGSIRTFTQGRLIIGQIQFPRVQDPGRLLKIVSDHRDALIREANHHLDALVRRGGGVQDLSLRVLERPETHGGGDEKTVVLHVLCDPCDAMGANLINQVCENLKPGLEALTGEKIGLCILSNLVDGRLSIAEVLVRGVDPDVAKGIEEAALFAKIDPYRAATHNKGVLNGIDPIVVATGNDWRAVEAGVHAYAARSGRYGPVTDWRVEGADLVGRFEAPISLGTVGGVTRSHPVARVAMKILGVEHADELARICAAVGLVQNLGALRALSTVGIVKGHMRLHTANLAIAAGAELHEVATMRERLAEVLKVEKRVTLTHAQDLLASLRRGV